MLNEEDYQQQILTKPKSLFVGRKTYKEYVEQYKKDKQELLKIKNKKINTTNK